MKTNHFFHPYPSFPKNPNLPNDQLTDHNSIGKCPPKQDPPNSCCTSRCRLPDLLYRTVAVALLSLSCVGL